MNNFHSLRKEAVLKDLKTSLSGLNLKEVRRRQARYQNIFPEKNVLSRWKILLSQFNNSLIIILAISGVLSTWFNHYTDAVIIFLAIFINAAIGYLEEYKANRSLDKLKKMVEHKAYVLRGEREYKINSNEVTLGDIIFIKNGNKIPADARLIESVNLHVNEASLTGEPLPSTKGTDPVLTGAPLADRDSMVYAGTIAVRGRGMAVVCAVGEDTEIGKIAKLVSETKEEKTPLQKKLDNFSSQIGRYVVWTIVAILALGFAQGRSLIDVFLIGVALAVAAIPEGLAVAVTVILTVGMQRMLKRKALIRKLVASETLGSVTVICSDKTGTLTEGKMHVAHIIIGEKEFELSNFGSRQDEKEAKLVSLALQIAMMANDASIENPDDELSAWRIIGESTDAALLSAAVQSGLDKDKLLKLEPKIDELPFDSDLKYTISLHQKKKGSILYEKGAPEKILLKSNYFYHQGKKQKLSDSERKKLKLNYESLTKKGLRLIAVAYRDLDNFKWSKGSDWKIIDDDLTFVGFIALKDPLRKEAKETIAFVKEASIRPIIITGDHRLTAQAIAREVGVHADESHIMTGAELDKVSDDKLKGLISKINVYARVSPHHKLRIVKALQAQGDVVAMTGDGINDSPALKAADIGISLGTATDIAKESSDIVLLDDNFRTIVDAIGEGRIVFRNIRKVITFLLSDSFSQLILVVGSMIFGMPMALLPAQILWMNIVQDGFPGFSLAMEKGDPNSMKRRPTKKDEPILNQEMKVIIFMISVVRDLLVFGVFIYMYRMGYNIDFIRTLLFATLAVNSLINIFSVRSLLRPIWKVNPFSNWYLIVGVLLSFGFLLAGVYLPILQKILSTVNLPFVSWFLVLMISIISLTMIELVKAFYRKHQNE